MKCPRCQSDTSVKDSRPTEENTIRRRRVCDGCGYRFNTYEMTKNFARNRQKHLEYKDRWRKNNPEKLREQRKRDELRRSARREAKATGTPVEQIYAQWGVA